MPSNVGRAGARRVAGRAALACAALSVAFSAAATIAPTLPSAVPEVVAPALTAPALTAPPRVPPAAVIADQAGRPYGPQSRLIAAHPTPADPFPSPPGDSDRPGSATGIAGLATDGIPSVALAAYREAAHLTDRADPGCHLSWTLLAGIGRVESDHGRFAGATLLSDGTSSTKIIGIALNGNGTEVVTDTDGGRLDGDPVFDRAVGPMQFIPSTWASYGVDGDGDGIADPFDINDAALAAAHYLCASGADLSTRSGQIVAVLTYNHSAAYVAEVLALAAAYATGVTPQPIVLALGRGPSGPSTPRTHSAGPKDGSGTPRPTTSITVRTSARRTPPASSSTQAPSTHAPSTATIPPRTSMSATDSTSMTNSSSTVRGTATSSAETPCPTPMPSTPSGSTSLGSAPATETTAATDTNSSATESATGSPGQTSATDAPCSPAGVSVAQSSSAAAAPGVLVVALLVLIGAGLRRRTAHPAHV